MSGNGPHHKRSLVKRGEFTTQAVRWVYTMSCAWCGAILKREAGEKSVFVAFDLAAADGWVRRKDGWKCRRCLVARAMEDREDREEAKRRRRGRRDGQGRRPRGRTRKLVREWSLDGLSARRIAAKLNIRLRTVHAHRKILRERGELRYFDERAKGTFARSGRAGERR